MLSTFLCIITATLTHILLYNDQKGEEKMSFFCNFQSDKCPGQINGNPINGLCEKVCVQVKNEHETSMRQTKIFYTKLFFKPLFHFGYFLF